MHDFQITASPVVAYMTFFIIETGITPPFHFPGIASKFKTSLANHFLLSAAGLLDVFSYFCAFNNFSKN